MSLEQILEIAKAIADPKYKTEISDKTLLETVEQSPKGHDEAAKFLAPYRKKATEELSQNPDAMPALLNIVTAQCDHLIQAGKPDKAAAIADWFTHILHQNNESKITQRPLRNAYARFFRTHARALKTLKRYPEMRRCMRNAIDTSSDLPLAIIALIHLYADLDEVDDIEGQNGKDWLSDRLAECLAALDYAGQYNSDFRQSLDELQFTLRHPEKANKSLQNITKRNKDNDLAHSTLKNIFKWKFIDEKNKSQSQTFKTQPNGSC